MHFHRADVTYSLPIALGSFFLSCRDGGSPSDRFRPLRYALDDGWVDSCRCFTQQSREVPLPLLNEFLVPVSLESLHLVLDVLLVLKLRSRHP